MATKTKSIAAEMEVLGFPYEATHPAQMANMIATGSPLGWALVATVDDGPSARMFVGYYSTDEAAPIAEKARRVRRMKVTSVVLFNAKPEAF